MRKLTRKCLAAGVAATGVAASASAQDPGPTVRISRVVAVFDERRPLVTRGLAPDDRPPQAMPSWLAGPTPTAVRPLTGAEQAAASVAPAKKPGLVESTYTGMKSYLAPPAGQAPGRSPTPLPQGMLPPAAQYAPPTTPGVYAGPPAYRWYGYGAVTPGRNPHAPDGVSPRGSPNWYVQSGATPGAFPVTVTASGQTAAGRPVPPPELPSYTLGNVAGSLDRPTDPPAPPTPAPAFAPDPSQPLPVTVTAVEPASLSTPAVAASEPVPVPVFTTPPRPPEPALMPTVTPVPTGTPSVTPPARLNEPPAFAPAASTAPVPVAAPEPPGPQPLLTWNSSSTDPAVAFSGSKPAGATVASVAPVSPAPVASVTPVTATVAPVTPAVVPASAVVPAAPPAVVRPVWGAAKPLGRSQGPGDAAAPTLEQAVRNAAYGFATVLEVRHTGPSAVTVRLQAATAADFRSAAELVSKLPALKPMAVEFVPPQAR